MVHISNKTIAVLLVIALAITISGTFVSVNKLVGLRGYDFLTGAAVNTTTGSSSITVRSITQITNRVSTIAFGTGYVNDTCNYCYIDSGNGTAPGNGSCCVSFNNVTGGFFIENTGNFNVTLNFTCTGSCNSSSFVNGTKPWFQFRMTNSSDLRGKMNNSDSVNDTRSSCVGNGSKVGWNYSDWNNMSYGADLCGTSGSADYGFTYNSTADAVVMDLLVGIPEDSRAGIQQAANLTFNGVSAG